MANDFDRLCDDCRRTQLRAHADADDLPELCSRCRRMLGYGVSTPTPSYFSGCAPSELVTLACSDQCPRGFQMTLRSPNEWRALSEAWNQGIDSHLEAITARSSADAQTGKVLVHPAELATLLRRLYEAGEDDASDPNPAWDLRSSILATLGIEEI